MKKNVLKIFILSAMFILYGCVEQYNANPSPSVHTLIKQVRAGGAKVIREGDRLSIVIPTDSFFELGTTQLRAAKVITVRKIGLLAKKYSTRFTKPVISVSGYTDKVFAHRSRRRISKQYAEVIASFLWHQGVARHRMKIMGYGSRYPVGGKRTGLNRRVVVKVSF